jgi:hypothetical protein
VIEARNIFYDIIYLELKYIIDKPIYISDEVTEGLGEYSNLENENRRMYYSVRGNSINYANESTKWPPLLRRIEPNEILAVRIDLKKYFKQILSDFDESIQEIDLVILDYYFAIDSEESQIYLSPKEMYPKRVIHSDIIRLKRSNRGYWYIEKTIIQSSEDLLKLVVTNK